MKKIFTVILYTAVALAVAGCAKADQPGPNDANKRFFDAWIKVHHPDVKPTGLGIYVIEETEGSGAVVGKDGFAIVDYTITDLEGNITSFTDKMTAKQLGEYDTAYYYGSKVWTTAEGTIQAGVAEALLGMKAGGSKKVIIPSWLMTYKTYDTAEDYINPPKKKNETTSVSYDNAIYNFTV